MAYGQHKVVDNVSFSIPRGSIASIVGPNGSGKTTLVRAMLGLTAAEKGTVLFFGKHLSDVRHEIGYVPQRFNFERRFPITVHEFLDLARHKDCPVARIKEKIREVGLDYAVLNKTIGELSGGQLQRILIAQAILNDPTLLVLDEPSSGIDMAGEAVFQDILQHLNRDHQTTIILVSHDIAMVSKIVDTVICLNKTLLCFGPPQIVLGHSKLTELYGEHAHVFEKHTHDNHDKKN